MREQSLMGQLLSKTLITTGKHLAIENLSKSLGAAHSVIVLTLGLLLQHVEILRCLKLLVDEWNRHGNLHIRVLMRHSC